MNTLFGYPIIESDTLDAPFDIDGIRLGTYVGRTVYEVRNKETGELATLEEFLEAVHEAMGESGVAPDRFMSTVAPIHLITRSPLSDLPITIEELEQRLAECLGLSEEEKTRFRLAQSQGSLLWKRSDEWGK